MTKREQSTFLAVCIAVLFAVFFADQQPADAYFEGNHRYDGQSIVNGVDFKLYKSFPDKWHLVTTGFAEDVGRMTVVYTNPPAFAYLTKMKKSGSAPAAFPDGAALGRVVFTAEKDPRVAGVRRPTAAREYQLMVRSSEKYKSTDGWGFARFNESGLSFNEDPQVSATSCFACHSLAKKEQYVFSKLADFAPVVTPAPKSKSTDP